MINYIEYFLIWNWNLNKNLLILFLRNKQHHTVVFILALVHVSALGLYSPNPRGMGRYQPLGQIPEPLLKKNSVIFYINRVPNIIQCCILNFLEILALAKDHALINHVSYKIK